jgi:hypothetical protein
MGQSAEELHRRAVELSIRGKNGEAERVLVRAWASAGDVDLRARILGTRAVVLQRTGHAADAERELSMAMALEGLQASTRAVLMGQLGALALGVGRLHDAEQALAAAIEGLGGDPVAAARVRMNRSIVRLQLRDATGAAEDLSVAAEIFGQAGLSVDEGQAQHNRAYVALLQGDLVTALRGMEQARPQAAASAAAGGICDADRAEVLRDAGLTRDAEQLLASAATVFGAHRMPISRAEAEYHLAVSQLRHDPVRAERTATAAMRRFRALGNDTWANRAEAIRLRAGLRGGSVQRGGGRVPDPRRVPTDAHVEATAAVLDQDGSTGEAAALRLTHAIWRARHGAAPTGPIRAPREAAIEVQLLAHEARAARAQAQSRPADARRYAAAGLDELAQWQASFGSLDLQTSVAMHGNGLILAGLDSAVRSKRPDVLFEWSERARLLSQQVVPLRPPPDEHLAADLAELRMLRADDPDWLAQPRAAELRERARSRQWTQTGAAQAQPRCTLDELTAALDSRTALVSFVFSGDALTALVVTDGAQTIVPLPGAAAGRAQLAGLRADLDMAASVSSGPMAAVVRRTLDARLQAIADVLLGPVLTLIGDRRVVLTAPGVLAGIPWAMLPDMSGRTFTLATSASRWLSGRRARPAAAHTAAFVAGPRVARGDEEVRAAASRWPQATLVTGEEATTHAATALAAHADVLHIAAHGRHAADNPLFSGLELADGALFGYDVDLVERVPETVVLSACEGGRSSVRWGEEAIGMARVWLHAGARCVVATPVMVADDDACELLAAMHEGLVAGHEPAEALAEASRSTGLVTSFQVHGMGF